MQKKPLMIGVAAALLLVATLLFLRQCRTPSSMSAVHNAIGVALVDKISAVAGGAGQVVLLTPTGNAEDTPESAAFSAAVKTKAKGLQVAGCEAWASQWSALEGGSGFLSSASLQAVTAKYPQAGVIVSFEGVPDPREIGRWPALSAKLVLISARQSREIMLAAKPVAALALVGRTIAQAEPNSRDTPEQALAKVFETL